MDRAKREYFKAPATVSISINSPYGLLLLGCYERTVYVNMPKKLQHLKLKLEVTKNVFSDISLHTVNVFCKSVLARRVTMYHCRNVDGNHFEHL